MYHVKEATKFTTYKNGEIIECDNILLKVKYCAETYEDGGCNECFFNYNKTDMCAIMNCNYQKYIQMKYKK